MKNLHSTEHISHTHSGIGRQLGKDKRFGPPLDICLQMSGLLKNSHLLSPLSFLLICFHLLCLQESSYFLGCKHRLPETLFDKPATN